MTKKRGGYPMPEIIQPASARHVCIPVPDEPRHRQAFLGNLLQLARPWNWGEGRTEGDEEVAAVWREIWLDTALQMDQAYEDCGERVRVEERCKSYYPFSPFIELLPASPYDNPLTTPPGYFNPPWFSPESAIELDWTTTIFEIGAQAIVDVLELVGLLEQYDALTMFGSFPLGWQTITSGIPRFTVKVRGFGQVQLNLLNVILGSRALVYVDTDFTLDKIIDDIMGIVQGDFESPIRLIDTDLDYTSLPPETDSVNTEIIEIEDDGEHTIHVIFVPVLDDQAIPITYGGGLRSVTLCGENIFPVWPEGTEPGEGEPGEGEIPVAETNGCGCNDLKSIFESMLLGAAYGLYNDPIPPGTTIGDGGDNDGDGEDDGRINPGTGVIGGSPVTPELPANIGDAEVSAGSAYKVVYKFNEALEYIWERMQENSDLWDDDNGTWNALNLAVALASIVLDVSMLYEVDQDVLASYITYLVEHNIFLRPELPEEELAGYFFCLGAQPIAISKWAADTAPTKEERDLYFAMSAIFSNSQLSYWYSLGASQPRTDYQTFPCLLRESVEWTFSPADINYSFNSATKLPDMDWPERFARTLIYVTLSGTVQDGSIQEDPLYRFDDLNNLEKRMLGIRWNDGATANVYPFTKGFPPYNPAHTYSFSFVLPAGAKGAPSLFWGVDSNSSWNEFTKYDSDRTVASGQFTIRITDGGLI